MSYVKPYRLLRTLQRCAPKSNSVGWRFKETVDSVLSNGVGRYICQLHRLTIVLDKQREDSGPIRTYIQQHLPHFSEKNPGVVVYVLPKRHKTPYIVGEYLNGRQASVNVGKFNVQEISMWMQYFRTRSGRRIGAFEQNMATERPSIQGMWNPFTNVPPQLNVNEEWPSEEYSLYNPITPTATEQVRQMYIQDLEEEQLGKDQEIEENISKQIS